MVNVRDLDLPVLPIGEQAFADGPDPFMIAALKQHSWLAGSDFGIVLTDYDAATQILHKDDVLKTPCEHVIEIMGGEGTDWARFERECLIALDGERHDRIRNAVNSAFTPLAVKAHVGRIQRVLTELLDEWAPKGRFDFEAFASRFPVAVMFGLLGIPRERIEDVKFWLEMFGQSFSLNREIFPEVLDSYDNLQSFAEERVAKRKAEGASGEPDLLDALIAAETSGEISHMEMIDLIMFLFAGGYDTSKNQIGHIMNLLLDRPEIWERCAEDRKFCDEVADETFRYAGVPTSYRNVASEFEFNGVTFPAGTMLIFPLSIVCRYSGPFDSPGEFRPGRESARRHTVFGRGMHMCLGQFLARLQIAEGLHLMAQRLKHPRRDGDMAWRLFPGVWGPLRLPIAFDPVAT